jgi:hypothetical protein
VVVLVSVVRFLLRAFPIGRAMTAFALRYPNVGHYFR